MKNLVPKTLLPVAGILILAALPCAAQFAIEPAPEAPRLLRGDVIITLRHVSPALMAFWLDPKNNPLPPALDARAASNAATLHLKFPLPAGVDRVDVLGSLKAILVSGSDEGVRRLRDIVAFLDRPQRQSRIEITARLLSISEAQLGGVWADLAARAKGDTPAMAFLKPPDELELGGQIARREAKFESQRTLDFGDGASQLLEFSSRATSPEWMRNFRRDFRSEMLVIPPPDTGDMQMLGPSTSRNRAVPAPLDQIRLQLAPTLQPDDAISLELREVAGGDVLGRPDVAVARIGEGETLALALPIAAPGTRAFLLFTARNLIVFAPLTRVAPDLRALPPSIGGLFKTPQKPQRPKIGP